MNHQFETVEFEAYDGVKCNLKHLINDHVEKSLVILVYGAGVRANIFNPTSEKNIISMLAEEGYDVRLENWTGSPSADEAGIDMASNHWKPDNWSIKTGTTNYYIHQKLDTTSHTYFRL